ncbi:hypothetical protein [Mycobacterium sp. AZCC_0083]|uniref:hypothetical protein n=1 Tax=Mycobacterium sp. AZCC_0083 TaxID=2735882 RepID=UPI00160B1FCE|nr:hypothetical protein [Mycobacterium sp. AZCC_0083]MBB5167131.1 ABC-type glutathione transport system ATPase component [Mycobacterium sp. AZCC_0083]
MTDAEILDAIAKLRRERSATPTRSVEHHYEVVCEYADAVNALLDQRQRGWKRIFKA